MFSLTIINIKRHILNRDNNKDNLKTYIHKQTTIQPQVWSIKWKDKTKLCLANVSIEYALQFTGKNI